MVIGRFRKNRTSQLEKVANAPIGSGVSAGDIRGIIRGTLIFDEDGDRWVEHMVQDSDGPRYWLSVENFEETEAILWSDVEIQSINGGPSDSRIGYQGETYRMNETGTAGYVSKGEVDVVPQGKVDYLDFVGPDGKKLGFERFGDASSSRRCRAVSGVCPNCHAPLKTDMAGRCTACGADLKADQGKWGAWEVAFGQTVTDSARIW